MEKFLNTHEINVLKKKRVDFQRSCQTGNIGRIRLFYHAADWPKKRIAEKIQIIPVKGLPIITNWSLVWLKVKAFTGGKCIH